MKISLWITVILLVVGCCEAQEFPSTQPDYRQQVDGVQAEDQSQPTVEESIPAAKTETEDITSRGSQSFSDDVFRSTRNHWGFSLSANEAYSTDSVPRAQRYEDATITSLASQIFFNLAKISLLLPLLKFIRWQREIIVTGKRL